jgi:hypothetical protein
MTFEYSSLGNLSAKIEQREGIVNMFNEALIGV